MTANHRLAGLSRRRLFVALFVLLSMLVPLGTAQAQSGACASSSNAGYTVTVCITQPANGATVSGLTTVTATADISGSSSGIGKLIFSLDGSYLLTDFQSPYTYSLPSGSFANGTHTLSVYAAMRDGFNASSPDVSLNFANGSAPPPGPAFTPVAPGPPPAGQSLIMSAVGDGAGGETNAAQVTQMIDGWHPDVFLYLGDVYDKGSYTEFYNWYGQTNLFYGLFRNVTDPVIGNHEYEGGVAPGYFAFWNSIPNYYSYTAGGWHFIALNSTSQFNQTAPGTGQYQWLLNDLSSNNSACTIAYFHHPVVSVGPQGDTPSMDAIWSQLVQAGVDIVLTGHDHGYQRWVPLDANLNPDPHGTTQFVNGAGGHAVQNFVRSDPRFVVGFGDPVNSYGAMYFKLNPKGAEYRYYNTAGELLDQGVVPCSGAAPDTTAPTTPGNLVAATSDGGQVGLSWNASWDETGVASYEIYRDGALIASVGGAETGYEDANVDLGVTYNYQVEAVDPGGLHSAQSNTATITRSAQATLIFNPSADTYVRSDNPTGNYGSASSLRADASPDTQSYLRFDLQGVSGTVTSATLRVFANNGSGTGYQVYTLAGGSWDESTVTYASRPAIGSQVASSGSFGSGGTWTEADLTSLIGGDGQLDLALTTSSNTAISLSSREGAEPPQLVVNVTSASATSTPAATPTPAATDTPAPTPTDTPAATSTPTATATPTGTAAATPTGTVAATPTGTAAATPTDTPTPTATATPTATPTPTATAGPATLSFAPVADAYVDGSKPSNNFGTSLALREDTSPDMRSYLTFDVQGLSASVTSATLSLYANSGSSAGYEVHAVADSTWAENTINYSNAPPVDGTAAAASGSVCGGLVGGGGRHVAGDGRRDSQPGADRDQQHGDQPEQP